MHVTLVYEGQIQVGHPSELELFTTGKLLGQIVGQETAAHVEVGAWVGAGVGAIHINMLHVYVIEEELPDADGTCVQTGTDDAF